MTISFILHTSKTINPCLSQILDPFKLFWCFKAKEFLCRSVEGLLLLASDVILGFLLNFTPFGPMSQEIVHLKLS